MSKGANISAMSEGTLKRRERELVEDLADGETPDWIRPWLQSELDWLRRGAPKSELPSEGLAERMQFTADYKIPARFEHLQYPNKGKGPEFD